MLFMTCDYLWIIILFSNKMKQPDQALQLSNFSFSNNNALEAIGILNQAIESYPTLSELYQNRGVIFSQSDSKQAMKDLNTATEMDRSDYIPYYNLFVLSYRMGNPEEALDHLYCCLSNCYLKRGLYNKSQSDIEKAIGYANGNAMAHATKAIFLYLDNKLISALSEINSAIGFEFENIALYQLRAHFLHQCNKNDLFEGDIDSIKKIIDKRYGNRTRSSQDFARREIPLKSNHRHTGLSIASTLKLKLDQLSNIYQDIEEIAKEETEEGLLFVDSHQKVSTVIELLITSLTPQISEIIVSYSKRYELNQSRTSSLNASGTKNMNRQFSNQELVKSSSEKKLFEVGSSRKIQDKSLLENKSMQKLLPLEEETTDQIYPLKDDKSKLARVTIKSALLTNNKEMFGQMDPYCKFTYNNKQYSTPVIKQGGMSPKWNFTIVFALAAAPKLLTLTVLDKETLGSDDFVGKGEIMIETYGQETVVLFQKNVMAGEVFINIEKVQDKK